MSNKTNTKCKKIEDQISTIGRSKNLFIDDHNIED